MPDSSRIAVAKPTASTPLANHHILTAAKGGGIIFAGNLFAYASRFIFGTLVARAIGANGYGLYDLAVTLALVLTGVAALGLPGGIERFLPAALRQHDEARIWGLLQISLVLAVSCSLVLALALFGLSDWVAIKLFHEPAMAPMLRIASTCIPLIAMGRIFMAAVRGFKQMQYQVYADSILANVTKILLSVIFLSMGLGAAGVLMAYVVAWLAETGLVLFYLNHLFSLWRPLRSARYNVREVLSFSFPLWLTEITTTFGRQIELLILGMLGTVSSVGVYSAALRIQLIGVMLLTAIQTTARPIISDLQQRSEQGQLHQLYRTLTKWSVTFNLPFFLTTVLFARPVLGIFGNEFTSGGAVLVIVALGTFVNASTGICGSMISMTGHSKLSFYDSVASLVLALTLDVLLIRAWGMVGAAVATGLVTTIMSMVRLVQVYWLLKIWPYDLGFFKPVMAGLAALIIGWGMNYFVPADRHLLFLVLDIGLLWASYAATLLGLGLSEEDWMVINRTKSRLGTMLTKRQNPSKGTG